jgi:formate--tetrahydrofolate ligase
MSSLPVPSDIEIARHAHMRPMHEIADALQIPHDDIIPYGRNKSKVSLDLVDRTKSAVKGKLILVTAISPTPAGEGKTTTTIGLGDALNRIGKRSTICLREPSLGPCFGMKGGAAGGGYSQVVPMEDINLHFTGDFHAITSAHNLLAALIDNHLHHGNALDIDPARIVWKRALDMNDRALRQIITGVGAPSNGVTREAGFDITVASEVMAIFCLTESISELRDRLGRMIVAYSRGKKPITAGDLNAQGAMTVLLREALQPNLVQTLENNPAFVHGGPFANIAHGCNSVIATKLAMRLSEFTVTEAGFGADLGAEKFLNIKCRQAGLQPAAVVLVATVRALKMHGGVKKKDLATPHPAAVQRGLVNLEKHLENLRTFGLPVVVAINHFLGDAEEELLEIESRCRDLGVKAIRCHHWAQGSAGAVDLAHEVVAMTSQPHSAFDFLYPAELPLWEKIRCVAQKIYGAADISAAPAIRTKLRELEQAGLGHLPVCMAKTQYSFSTDPTRMGRPQDFEVPIRDVKVSAGAGFVVVLTGEIMTMPGLPASPAAEQIDLDSDGNIVGLF